MKQMNDRVFVDSNVLLYLLSDDDRKKGIAKKILASRPTISTQVVSENINVLFKKFRSLTPEQIKHHADLLLNCCDVLPLDAGILATAMGLKIRYQFQWYDATIIAAALSGQCTIIYTEDLQNNQIIEDKLSVSNPFL